MCARRRCSPTVAQKYSDAVPLRQGPVSTPTARATMAGLTLCARGRGLDSLQHIRDYITVEGEGDAEPHAIPEFHEVAHLSLRHNAFTEHGLGGLGAFSGLVTLNLAHNRIASLHGLLEHCPRALRRLNLAHNAISYIPSQMPLASLQDLDLSGNLLSGVVHVPLLPALRTLLLHNNGITALTGLEQCPDLDLLNVCHNGIEDVGALGGVRECGRLGKLLLHANPIALCPRYRYAVLEALPGLVLFDDHNVPKYVTSITSFCHDHERAVAGRFSSGCGFPHHSCPRGPVTVTADGAVSAPPSPPPLPEGGVVCAPRREFDVVPTPFPRVVCVAPGDHSSLDDRVHPELLNTLRERCSRPSSAAATPAPRRSIPEPAQPQRRVCRCAACNARAGLLTPDAVSVCASATGSGKRMQRPKSGPVCRRPAPAVCVRVGDEPEEACVHANMDAHEPVPLSSFSCPPSALFNEPSHLRTLTATPVVTEAKTRPRPVRVASASATRKSRQARTHTAAAIAPQSPPPLSNNWTTRLDVCAVAPAPASPRCHPSLPIARAFVLSPPGPSHTHTAPQHQASSHSALPSEVTRDKQPEPASSHSPSARADTPADPTHPVPHAHTHSDVSVPQHSDQPLRAHTHCSQGNAVPVVRAQSGPSVRPRTHTLFEEDEPPVTHTGTHTARSGVAQTHTQPFGAPALTHTLSQAPAHTQSPGAYTHSARWGSVATFPSPTASSVTLLSTSTSNSRMSARGPDGAASHPRLSQTAHNSWLRSRSKASAPATPPVYKLAPEDENVVCGPISRVLLARRGKQSQQSRAPLLGWMKGVAVPH